MVAVDVSLLSRRTQDIPDATRLATVEAQLAAANRRIAALNAELCAVRAHRARIENDRLALLRQMEDRARAEAPGPYAPTWAPEPTTPEVTP